MNKKGGRLIFLAISLSFCLTLAAQENTNQAQRVLTEDEYYTAVRNASGKTQKQKRRVTFTNENDAPTADNKRILFTEFAAPNRQRSVYDFYENGILRRYEEIVIRRKVYFRYDAETNWNGKIREDIYGAYSKGETMKIERLLIKKETVNGQTADLYQQTETSGYPNLPNAKPVVETIQYWINAAGLIVRYSRSITDSSLRKTLNTVEDYEYNSTIKIIAPAVGASRTKKIRRKK